MTDNHHEIIMCLIMFFSSIEVAGSLENNFYNVQK